VIIRAHACWSDDTNKVAKSGRKGMLSGVHDEATKNKALKNMQIHFDMFIGAIVCFWS
jgi:hypothetical protein